MNCSSVSACSGMLSQSQSQSIEIVRDRFQNGKLAIPPVRFVMVPMIRSFNLSNGVLTVNEFVIARLSLLVVIGSIRHQQLLQFIILQQSLQRYWIQIHTNTFDERVARRTVQGSSYLHRWQDRIHGFLKVFFQCRRKGSHGTGCRQYQFHQDARDRLCGLEKIRVIVDWNVWPPGSKGIQGGLLFGIDH